MYFGSVHWLRVDTTTNENHLFEGFKRGRVAWKLKNRLQTSGGMHAPWERGHDIATFLMPDTKGHKSSDQSKLSFCRLP